jgi:hypothetical protein
MAAQPTHLSALTAQRFDALAQVTFNVTFMHGAIPPKPGARRWPSCSHCGGTSNKDE